MINDMRCPIFRGKKKILSFDVTNIGFFFNLCNKTTAHRLFLCIPLKDNQYHVHKSMESNKL